MRNEDDLVKGIAPAYREACPPGGAGAGGDYRPGGAYCRFGASFVGILEANAAATFLTCGNRQAQKKGRQLRHGFQGTRRTVKYFDTAFIIKLYLREPGSKEVIALANGAGGLACSDLGFSEFHAALHRNLREDMLTRPQFDQALARFDEDSRIGQWHWIPITRDIHQGVAEAFRTAPKSVFLRCADAIHLTTANLHGFGDVCSNDRHLTKAAPAFGLTVTNPLSTDEAGT